jgi:hypothetical protein
VGRELSDLVRSTDRGRSVSPSQVTELEKSFEELESHCTFKEPARSPLVQGNWIVEYTDAPPPSNGQLGPFKGVAYQEVDLESGRYANILRVPPNDWLMAILEASWKEWDGVLLKDACQVTNDVDDSVANVQSDDIIVDHGATCWVVRFESLTIRLFGIPIFTQKFENTQRVWRTTYVDESTRIVRAGRTGRRQDEMLFYMTRSDQNLCR